MKRLLTLILFVLCSFALQAQSNAITLDELLGRITADMTEEQYFAEFKNELHLLDSLEQQKYIMSEDMTSIFLGEAAEIQQKAEQMGFNQNEESTEEQNKEIWVISVDIEGFGMCAVFAQYEKDAEDGCLLCVMLPKEIHNLQSTYVLKKAKNTLNKYAQTEYIEMLSTDSMILQASIWEKGLVMIMQTVSDSQCLTLLVFQFTSKQLNDEDMKLAAEYMKNGTMPEESAPTAQNQSFEFPSIRNVKWGDSISDVMRKEGKRDELTNYCLRNNITDTYMFFDKVNGRKCVAVYAFTQEDQAYQLVYDFKEIPDEHCLLAYNQLKSLLKNKYGEPKSEEVEKRYDWTREEWQQVSYGNLGYTTSWLTDDFVYIELRLNQTNGSISCVIHYVYLPLKLLEEQKESGNL